jgi:hypothetical protein
MERTRQVHKSQLWVKSIKIVILSKFVQVLSIVHKHSKRTLFFLVCQASLDLFINMTCITVQKCKINLLLQFV